MLIETAFTQKLPNSNLFGPIEMLVYGLSEVKYFNYSILLKKPYTNLQHILVDSN